MSSRKVEVTEVEQAIMDALEKYKDSAQKVIQEALPKVGKETANELQQTSPKRKGDYAKGWKWQLDPRKKAKNHAYMVVYNKTHYRLTHLLENGHAKVDGGRVKAFPHIRDAAEHATQKAIDYIKQGLENDT